MNGLVGLFYSQGDYGYGFQGTGIFPDGMGGVMPFNRETRLLEEVDQLGLFGRMEWAAGDRALVTGGVRLNRETRRNDNFADNNGLTSNLDAEETFVQVLPSGSFAWNLAPTTSLGASYARGYKAGGFAFAVFLSVAEAFGEEYTDNYELFLRHRTSDGRLMLNANVFAIDWRDQQVPYTAAGGIPGFDALVANAGRSALRGVEVEAEYHFNRALNLFASLGVTDSEFIDFILDGKRSGRPALSAVAPLERRGRGRVACVGRLVRQRDLQLHGRRIHRDLRSRRDQRLQPQPPGRPRRLRAVGMVRVSLGQEPARRPVRTGVVRRPAVRAAVGVRADGRPPRPGRRSRLRLVTTAGAAREG